MKNEIIYYPDYILLVKWSVGPIAKFIPVYLNLVVEILCEWNTIIQIPGNMSFSW